MGEKIKKIALLTGDGDCPGLNAAIRAITRTAILNYGYEVIGFTGGFEGLYNNEYIQLDLDTVSGILRRGGSILYTSNKDDLFEYEIEENGIRIRKDASDTAVDNLIKNNVDALIVLGGDHALRNAYKFIQKGINIIGIPKTINNDIVGTDITFGFNSALKVAVQALDRLHTTAESHHRVMILEVMGGKAGWIALEAGIAGSADVILIPEIPYSIDKIIDKINKRKELGKYFTIIVVAEGAISKDEKIDTAIGGVGYRLADSLEKSLKDQEVRCAVLGHTQRGGDTSTFDRIIATRVGVKAVELINNGCFDSVLCVKGRDIVPVPIEEIIDRTKIINISGDLIKVARAVGIELGG
jgi:ATP-dependent phosphofructokinase / diphosphate-dependent phosphofructokinase